MTEGLLPYLTYRVIDPNSGAEVVNPLPHLHQSSWTTMALQTGLPGGGTLGSFTIPLFGPQTEEYAAAKSRYDLLDKGLKIEGYIGNVASGVPARTGVITGFRKTLKAWEIVGQDTLWWLAASLLLPMENLPATMTADQILARTNSTQELMVSDDFVGGSTDLTANYSPVGGFTAATDPNFNLPAAKWASGGNYLINKTSMATAQYQLSRADVIGSIVPSTDATDAGELGIVVQSDATAANLVFGRAITRNTGAGQWAVDAEIWQVVAGVATLKANAANVFTGLASPIRLQVTLVGTTPGGSGSGQVWRLFINGKDPAVFWQGSAAGGFSGLRAGGTGTVAVYADRIAQSFRNLASPRFPAGSVSVGTITPGQLISSTSQSLLDLWTQAMGLDEFGIRKNPGAGARGDSYDFAASPGTDLSGAVIFKEKGNLVDLELTQASEVYATDVRLTSVPSADSGGVIVWPRIGSPGDMVLTDTVTDVSIAGFTHLASAAQLLQQLKVNPWLAKTAIVERDPQTADKWRELDFVTLHAPSLNIQNLKVRVLGYTLTEGSLEQTVYLDQYAQMLAAIPARRLVRAVESLANTFQQR